MKTNLIHTNTTFVAMWSSLRTLHVAASTFVFPNRRWWRWASITFDISLFCGGMRWRQQKTQKLPCRSHLDVFFLQFRLRVFIYYTGITTRCQWKESAKLQQLYFWFDSTQRNLVLTPALTVRRKCRWLKQRHPKSCQHRTEKRMWERL